MMATNKKMKMLEREPDEVEMLLPWYAAGTLDPRDQRRAEEALARDPELAKQYAGVKEEYASTIQLNESLGAPSARAMQNLFAAIDAEPARRASWSRGLPARIGEFFASLSPRTLAWVSGLGAVALLLEAGVIAAVLMKDQPASFQTASLSQDEPTTRSLRSEAPPVRALVRFAPDARIADITALFDRYHATVVGTQGGMFRLQFGAGAMTKDQVADMMNRLQGEKIVSLAVATP